VRQMIFFSINKFVLSFWNHISFIFSYNFFYMSIEIISIVCLFVYNFTSVWD
jgi:hypothetical protein